MVRIKPGSLTHRTTQRTIVYLITDWIKGNGKLFFSFKWGSRHICVRVCACLCVSRCQGQTIRHCYSIECQLTTDSKNMIHHKHLMLFTHPMPTSYTKRSIIRFLLKYIMYIFSATYRHLIGKLETLRRLFYARTKSEITKRKVR